MKERKTYSDDFKAQIVKECQDVGNAALVAKRHGLSPKTVYLWLSTIVTAGDKMTQGRRK